MRAEFRRGLLEVEKLSFAYGGALALRDVSLRIDAGAIVALVGSNGAGKTTTVLNIAGALFPRSGTIMFDGTDVTGAPCWQMVEAGISLIPEGRLLFPHMTVAENLDMGAVSPRARNRREQNLKRIFEFFPKLRDRLTQTAGSMSGGEQQMLAIARGLMCGPKLLILDEPSLGLMPSMVRDLFAMICALRDEGLTILLVEQNVRQSLRIANYAYILEKGVVTHSDSGRSLLESPFVRRAYLGL